MYQKFIFFLRKKNKIKNSDQPRKFLHSNHFLFLAESCKLKLSNTQFNTCVYIYIKHTWCPYCFLPNQNSWQPAFEVAIHLSKPSHFKSKQINPLKTLKILPFSLLSSLHCSVCSHLLNRQQLKAQARQPQPLSDSLLSASLNSQLLTSPYQESGIKL